MDLQTSAGSADKIFKSAFEGISSEMQVCIQNCTLCHQVCEQTLLYCLTKEGKHLEPLHLKALIDCAQICTVSADFMSRESNIHAAVCGACAEACLECANSCERMGDDRMMKLCAEVCKRCEESCRMMAGQSH
ncbi:MAG: ferredoxin [Bdellovibrio sp. 28-41-41]|nr:MAG: ferredoxin [Bdellovibrio sp. 28-41-41]